MPTTAPQNQRSRSMRWRTLSALMLSLLTGSTLLRPGKDGASLPMSLHMFYNKKGLIQRYQTGQRGVAAGSCAGWEQDPASFSIHVARHFVATQVNPALAGKAVSVTCETDHDCRVTFGDDLTIDVYWYRSIRRVGAGRSTDQGRQFCAFDYSCDSSGQMILSGVKCHGTPKP